MQAKSQAIQDKQSLRSSAVPFFSSLLLFRCVPLFCLCCCSIDQAQTRRSSSLSLFYPHSFLFCSIIVILYRSKEQRSSFRATTTIFAFLTSTEGTTKNNPPTSSSHSIDSLHNCPSLSVARTRRHYHSFEILFEHDSSFYYHDYVLRHHCDLLKCCC